MKRILSALLSIFLIVSVAGCSPASNRSNTSSQQEVYLSRPQTQTVYGVEAPPADIVTLDVPRSAAAQTEAVQTAKQVSNEIRGVWLSYITLEPLAKNKTKAQFTAAMDDAFSNVTSLGLNTVFVQVRPFGDALYQSAYFPWAACLTGEEGRDPGYDPLAILCQLAQNHGLRIEAWINPYRIRSASGKAMSSSNPAKKWLAAGNDAVLEWNGGIYYNPGSAAARKLILNGVREIVENYKVDGIHFDDYFYPTTDASFDQTTYRASGSSLSQADWRRENVNTLVRDVYAAVKELDADCVFGISPQGNVKIDYEQQFADVAKWAATPGYVDYLCPQIYYGYKNSTCPYAQTVAQWDQMVKADGISLYVGIAAYKLGQEDQWAGEGKAEWLNTTSMLANMVKTARSAGNYHGVVFYSYDSLFSAAAVQGQAGAQTLKELKNLKALFK